MSFFKSLFEAIARLFQRPAAPAPAPVHTPEPQDKVPPKSPVGEPQKVFVPMSTRQMQAWDLWVGAQITRQSEVSATAKKVLENRARYEAAGKTLQMPGTFWL